MTESDNVEATTPLGWLAYRDEEQADGFPALSGKTASKRDLARAVAESAVAATPLSILMIDLDFFKRVNEVLGHDGADAVLTRVTEALRTTLGHRGKGYRWGGEELLAILPNFTEDEAGALAENFRDVIESEDFGGIIDVTISVGVTQRGRETAETCFSRADKAVYAAKSMGRNRVYLASGRPWIQGPPKGRRKKRKLIFVVDPDELYRNLVGAFLRGEGYDCRAAARGFDLLNQADIPDLLIAGPPEDFPRAGFLAAARARWPGILSFAIVGTMGPTGVADSDLVAECYRGGATYVLVKPIKADDVIAKTVSLIGPGRL